MVGADNKYCANRCQHSLGGPVHLSRSEREREREGSAAAPLPDGLQFSVSMPGRRPVRQVGSQTQTRKAVFVKLSRQIDTRHALSPADIYDNSPLGVLKMRPVSRAL